MNFGKWISCKEKMPDKSGKYLVTMFCNNGEYHVDFLTYGYTGKHNNKMCFHQWDDCFWQCDIYNNVIAWMPLPEAYLPKMQEQVLNLTHGKVNIFDDTGEFKSTYEIMQTIADVWEDN